MERLCSGRSRAMTRKTHKTSVCARRVSLITAILTLYPSVVRMAEDHPIDDHHTRRVCPRLRFSHWLVLSREKAVKPANEVRLPLQVSRPSLRSRSKTIPHLLRSTTLRLSTSLLLLKKFPYGFNHAHVLKLEYFPHRLVTELLFHVMIRGSDGRMK